jgi:hypothetical protein
MFGKKSEIYGRLLSLCFLQVCLMVAGIEMLETDLILKR